MNHLPPELLQFLQDQKEIHNQQKTIHDGICQSIREMRDEFREYQERTEPMIKWFSGMTVMKKTIMWVLGLLGALGSVILMWREIFK